MQRSKRMIKKQDVQCEVKKDFSSIEKGNARNRLKHGLAKISDDQSLV